jgi:hypothetical protein
MDTRLVPIAFPTTPRQLALNWSEDRSPFEDLRPPERIRVIARLAQMLLEALGEAREEGADELA